MSGPDFIPAYRHDATVYQVPPYFYKAVKVLRKSMREGAWIPSDPTVFRSILRGADPVLDAKEKAGGYQRLLEHVGLLIEDAAESRYYVDEKRIEFLLNEARLNDRLPRATCSAAERLIILKKAMADRKEAERLSAAASNGAGNNHANSNALSAEDANVMVGLLEEENHGLTTALETVKSEREQLKTENSALASAFSRVETNSAVLTEARSKLEIAEQNLSATTVRFATDSAMKQREIEGLEQSNSLLGQRLKRVESDAATEKTRADELQRKLDRLKPDLIDSARKGIGDLGTLLRLLANEGTSPVAAPAPASKPSQPPAAAATKGVKIEEIEDLIVKRAEFNQRVTKSAEEAQDEIDKITQERKDAESEQKIGISQEARVEAQIRHRQLSNELQQQNAHYSELMLLRRRIDDEIKKLSDFVDSYRKFDQGPPVVQSIPSLPKPPMIDSSFTKVEPRLAQLFSSRIIEIAQRYNFGQKTVMLASLYEICPKTAGGRASFSAQRVLRVLNYCGLMPMTEQQMEQAYTRFTEEYSREKRESFQLLQSSAIPNVQIPMYSRTKVSLPWKLDDLFTPPMKEAFLQAFELMGNLSSN